MLYTTITASSNGDNTVVTNPGDASTKIRVIAYVLSSSGTVNAKWQSKKGAGSATDITGLLYMAATTVLPISTGLSTYGGQPTGLFETNAGEDLHLNLSAGVAVGGHLMYELVR